MTITQGKQDCCERADGPADHIGVSNGLVHAQVLSGGADVQVRRARNKHDRSANRMYKYIGEVRLVVSSRREVEYRESDKPPRNAASEYSEQE